jgi:hypothetical protein
VHGLKQTFKHKASEPDMPTGNAGRHNHYIVVYPN